ncbi:MAG: hypothetical protein F6K19_46570 [Cyanothece sp. SIO1E1]|nr:hypothetical protein [Cyanothece sp. SIO1E1]
MGRRDNKRLVYVKPFANATIRYGFLTNIDQADGEVLGHQLVGNSTPPGLVIGANSPKPSRASRTRTTSITSSFIDIDSIDTAKSAGWVLTKRPLRRAGGTKLRSRTVKVDVAGVKYAWNMPLDTYTAISSVRAQLGIEDATSADEDLVFGASFPKPPVAGKLEFGEGGVDRFSTFISLTSSDNLPDDWAVIRAAKTLI